MILSSFSLPSFNSLRSVGYCMSLGAQVASSNNVPLLGLGSSLCCCVFSWSFCFVMSPSLSLDKGGSSTVLLSVILRIQPFPSGSLYVSSETSSSSPRCKLFESIPCFPLHHYTTLFACTSLFMRFVCFFRKPYLSTEIIIRTLN
jgi:hypothetical protein